MTPDTPVMSPADLIAALSADAEAHGEMALPTPTPQQAAVIAAGSEPALVVAGAGSGKTETMSLRVLWLIANRIVEPEAVLGLTFTRKAATELQERLHRRIAQVVRAGFITAEEVGAGPKVSTYNSFANELFREYALLIGRDPEAEVLSPTAAWMLAHDVVIASDDERLARIGSPALVTGQMLTLANQLGENAIEAHAVTGFAPAWLARFERLGDAENLRTKTQREAVQGDAETIANLPALLQLADEYEREKRSRGVVEFSDQVRLALQALEAHPDIVRNMRTRFPAVLLDEYQDTSVVQVQLLRTLFERHPVMAVGDPNQSIYGWRGAAAGTLERFHHDFGEGASFALSVSWRNPPGVLAIANDVASRLATDGVQRLEPRPGAQDEPISVQVFETEADEATALAQWFGTERDNRPGSSGAILFRARGRMRVYADALAQRGIPHVILGNGGLFDEPEVLDVAAALTVLAKPSAGSSLLRLLAGARWRIGVADLAALERFARTIARSTSEAAQQANATSQLDDALASIVDALDELVDLSDDAASLQHFSPVGRERLREAGSVFRALRASASLPLTDLVRAVERALMLDLEVRANPNRPGTGAMDALLEQVQTFMTLDPRADLAAFVAWLETAMAENDAAPPQVEPEPGIVQLTTIHGSKGLEWDFVAVPAMAAETLPGRARDLGGWFGKGQLPFVFRGDRDALPTDDPSMADDFEGYFAARSSLRDAMRDRHAAEERRLGYVAITRAAGPLWLSCARWVGMTKRSRVPGAYLLEAAAITGVELPEASEHDTNPNMHDTLEIQWPPDPLGARRGRVEEAARLVNDADPSTATAFDERIALLLAERDAHSPPTQLPARLAASGFKDWIADPVATFANVQRPVPQRPFTAARLGTLFHEWVEAKNSRLASSDLVDSLEWSDDDYVAVDTARLEQLRQTFMASEYGSRTPIATEQEIHLMLDGTTVVCKIDAVYEIDGRLRVVDWKTGRPPRNEQELAARQLQLALYRAAYARFRDVPEADVDAELYYVEDDLRIPLERLSSFAELEQQWRDARAALRDRLR